MYKQTTTAEPQAEIVSTLTSYKGIDHFDRQEFREVPVDEIYPKIKISTESMPTLYGLFLRSQTQPFLEPV